MKLKLIAAALSVSLVACVSTENTTTISSEPLMKRTAALAPVTNVGSVQTVNKVITLEQIMADPDWFGRAPESWYWGDDSNTVFYKQKQLGNPLRDLFAINLDSNNLNSSKEAHQISLTDHHIVADSDAKRNSDNSLEIYSFKGNVFVKNLASKTVKQITYTSASESVYSSIFGSC